VASPDWISVTPVVATAAASTASVTRSIASPGTVRVDTATSTYAPYVFATACPAFGSSHVSSTIWSICASVSATRPAAVSISPVPVPSLTVAGNQPFVCGVATAVPSRCPTSTFGTPATVGVAGTAPSHCCTSAR
jgi:hypothetical protein